MEPITRKEMYLNAIVNGEKCDVHPITREEQYLYAIANKEDTNVEPITRTEQLFSAWSAKKSEILLQDKTITENGTYTADEGYDGLGSVTVEVAGSGGGSLPAGGYWGAFEDIPRPNSYNWNWFELGGELYAFTAATTSETYVGIKYKYKMMDGAWVQLADETYVDAEMYQLFPVELNGKMHFLPKYGDYHWTFDGSVVTQMADFPQNIEHCRYVFVQEGKLKCYYRNTVYVWDETTDTWRTEATLSFLNYNIGIFMVDGAVYMSADSNMYNYENGAITQYATGIDTIYASVYHTVANGKLYYYKISSTKGTSLYCFDFAQKTNQFIAKIPTQLSYGVCYLKSYQGKVLSLHAKPTYATIFQLYEVTE